MPVLCSPIEKIDNLWFEPWKSGTVLKGADVLVVDDRTVIIKDKHGRLRCNRLGKYAYLPGNWPFNDSVFKGLVRLGVVTQEVADQHLAIVAERAAKRDRDYEVKKLTESAEKLGIKFTKAQLAALAAPQEQTK